MVFKRRDGRSGSTLQHGLLQRQCCCDSPCGRRGDQLPGCTLWQQFRLVSMKTNWVSLHFLVITVTYHNHVLCPRETSTSSSSTSDINFPQQQSIWSTVIYTAVSAHPTFYHLLTVRNILGLRQGLGKGIGLGFINVPYTLSPSSNSHHRHSWLVLLLRAISSIWA